MSATAGRATSPAEEAITPQTSPSPPPPTDQPSALSKHDREEKKARKRSDYNNHVSVKKEPKPKKKDAEEITFVTTILGARRSDDVINSLQQEASAKASSQAKGSSSKPSSATKEKRGPEAIQLVRPPTDTRDASLEAVNVLDHRSHELARDLSAIERSLIGSNVVFRVIGALGTNKSGKSSCLTATLTTSKIISQDKFHSSSKNRSGLEVFVEATRRVFLVEFPVICLANTKRSLDPPVFAPQYRDVEKLYDLRVAFTALVTCSVLLVNVVNESEPTEPIFVVLRAAAQVAKMRGWPIAKVVLVRNMVPVGQSMSMRRIQADERCIKSILPEDAPFSVVHVPRFENSSEREGLEAYRRLAKVALTSFALTSCNLPTPSKILARGTEADWLASLVFVFGDTRTQPFFIAGEEVGFLR